MNAREHLLLDPNALTSLSNEELQHHFRALKAHIATIDRCLDGVGITAKETRQYRDALGTGYTLLHTIEGEIGRRAIAGIDTLAQEIIQSEEPVTHRQDGEKEREP